LLTTAVEEVRGRGRGRGGRWTGNGLAVAPLGCVRWTGRGRSNVRKTRREQTDAMGGANRSCEEGLQESS
jgi:hypothetical protein